MRETKKSVFEGVSLRELEECERLFDVGVEVFEFDESESPPALVCVRRSSSGTPKKKLQVLAYQDHFCYISNINTVGHAFACRKCKKLWKNQWTLHRHEDKCNGTGQKNVYTGGVYLPPPLPLDREFISRG